VIGDNIQLIPMNGIGALTKLFSAGTAQKNSFKRTQD
jgi:hypothetical protein